MTRRIFIIVLIILGVIVAAVARTLITPADFETSAKKVGDLTVTWQSSPLFYVLDMLPGDTAGPKTVTIYNGGSSIQPLGIRGVIATQSGTLNFPDKLNLKIFENGNLTPFWDKSLADFFVESTGSGFIKFADLPTGATRTYKFTAVFDPTANNDYQEAKVVFNLIIGLAVEVPTECQAIAALPNVKYIFGTDKKETLTGGNYPNIIFGFGGDDVLNGNNQEDCLIGGDGNDKLHGNNKNDVLLGGTGDDNLNGNNGDDYLDGGPGNNKLDGSNGTDTCLSGTKIRCEK